MATKVGNGISKKTDSIEAAKEATKKALGNLNGNIPDVVMVFSSTIYDYGIILSEIKKLTGGAKIIGCSTAGEFTEEETSTNSLVVTAIKSDSMIFKTSSLNKVNSENYEKLLEDDFSSFKTEARNNFSEGFCYSSVFILMDCFIGNGESIIKKIHNLTGITSQIIGGAAGDDGKLLETHVFYDEKAEKSSITLLKIFSKNRIGIGVRHGMTENSKKMRVTKSEGSILYELDKKPAFEVYKEYAKTQGVELNHENAGNYLMNNELGIKTISFSRIRAPLGVNEDGSLNMATEVPKGSSVTFVSSEKDKLLSAAKEAAEESKENLEGKKASAILVFDCVCRQTILGDSYQDEVKTIQKVFGDDVPISGFSTYGEIAKYSGVFTGFHNSTAVVCALPE